MQTLLIGKRDIHKKPASYYLLADEFDGLGESYGVKIAYDRGEEACIRGITLSQSKILMLISILMRHSVTPVALQDVVEDWLLR